MGYVSTAEQGLEGIRWCKEWVDRGLMVVPTSGSFWLWKVPEVPGQIARALGARRGTHGGAERPQRESIGMETPTIPS